MYKNGLNIKRNYLILCVCDVHDKTQTNEIKGWNLVYGRFTKIVDMYLFFDKICQRKSCLPVCKHDNQKRNELEGSCPKIIDLYQVMSTRIVLYLNTCLTFSYKL